MPEASASVAGLFQGRVGALARHVARKATLEAPVHVGCLRVARFSICLDVFIRQAALLTDARLPSKRCSIYKQQQNTAWRTGRPSGGASIYN